MSHFFHVRCPKCGEDSESFNHAQQSLINAVRESYPLYLLSKTGWDVNTVERCDLGSNRGLAGFIVQHFACGKFLVVSEYYREGDTEPRYQPIEVTPVCGEYRGICLEQALKEGKELVDQLQNLLNVEIVERPLNKKVEGS